MLGLDVQRSTPLLSELHYRTGKARRDTRVHTSAETKTNIPWNTVVATHPIPDWKAFYNPDGPNKGSLEEVNLRLDMLAWDLPAVMLVTSATQKPFFNREVLHNGHEGARRFFPLALPSRVPLSQAGKDTVLFGMDLYPPGHNGTSAWMRSAISRERETANTHHSTMLLIDPVGQKSLQLRTNHYNKGLDQAVQVIITGKSDPRSKASLDFQTRIRVKQNGNFVEYLFDKDGAIAGIQNAQGHTIPVENPHQFAKHALGIPGETINHAQTLRSLWLNAGRTTPYNPLRKLTVAEEIPQAIGVTEPYFSK